MKIIKGILIITMITVLIVGCSKTDRVRNEEALIDELVNPDGVYHITMAYVGNQQADMDKVTMAINELTLKDLNMSVEFIQMGFGEYQEQQRLMLAGHDALDILPVYYRDAAAFIESGQLVDLSDYIEVYGQELIAQIGEERAYAGQIGGFLYGIPAMKESQTYCGVVMRKDIVEKYEIDVDSIRGYEDLTEVYQKIHEGEPTMDLLVGNNLVEQIETYDGLFDGFGVLLMNSESPNKVTNYYESEEYYKRISLIREWYKAGYIMTDAAITNEATVNLVKSGKAFSYFSSIKPGFLVQENIVTGYEMVTAAFDNTEFLYSQGINFFDWSIAQNSKDPAKAMEFLNYAYTNADFMNLLNWGIEGEHYVFINEEETMIGFPDGVDATNTRYNLNIGWELPNQFIGYAWEGHEADVWEQYEAFDNRAIKSPAYGFIFNPLEVQNELTALSNVRSRYSKALETGSVDPDVILSEFNEALYLAGLQKVIEAKQEQLDSWLHNQE